MMKYFLLPIYICASNTFLSSDHIAYKEQNLSLQGNVSIQHDLGVVKADEAEITGATESSFLHALLKSNVEFFFKEDRLVASELLLDGLKGEVTANGPTTLYGSSENFSLSCDGITQFQKETNRLTFTSKFLPILFQKGETQIQSKSAFLIFENNGPTTLVFDDAVHLSNGSIQGDAEALIYDLKDRSLHGKGKVSFILDSTETGNLLKLWKSS